MAEVSCRLYDVDYSCDTPVGHREGRFHSKTKGGIVSEIESRVGTKSPVNLSYSVTERTYSMTVDEFVDACTRMAQEQDM